MKKCALIRKVRLTTRVYGILTYASYTHPETLPHLLTTTSDITARATATLGESLTSALAITIMVNSIIISTTLRVIMVVVTFIIPSAVSVIICEKMLVLNATQPVVVSHVHSTAV